MTVDEFLVWDADDATGCRWQLVDGEPVLMSPAAEVHGLLQSEISGLLRDHFRATGRPCRMVTAPGIVPRVYAAANFRVRDLGVICSQPAGEVMVRDPVLLIEILPPSNEAMTRSNIWTYVTIPSVQEILTVRSTRIEAELLRRGDDGNWPEAPVTVRLPDTLTLTRIGFACPVSDLYATCGLTR